MGKAYKCINIHVGVRHCSAPVLRLRSGFSEARCVTGYEFKQSHAPPCSMLSDKALSCQYSRAWMNAALQPDTFQSWWKSHLEIWFFRLGGMSNYTSVLPSVMHSSAFCSHYVLHHLLHTKKTPKPCAENQEQQLHAGRRVNDMPPVYWLSHLNLAHFPPVAGQKTYVLKCLGYSRWIWWCRILNSEGQADR